MKQTETQKNWNNYYGQNKPYRSNRRNIIIIIIIVCLLLFPFSVETVNILGVEITLYKAVLYSVIRAESAGFVKTDFCFFPSNFDVNSNFKTLTNGLDGLNDTFKDLFNMK